MAIFEKKMPSVESKSPEDQRDKPKTQVNRLVMPAERFYIQAPLQQGDVCILSDQEHHHLTRVMRVREGDVIELINGKGVLADAQVKDILKNESHLLIIRSTIVPKDPFEVILAQAIPRANRLDTILEKGTELGMDQIWLFPGKLSEKKEISKKRAETILISAAKQCGRLYIPNIQLQLPIKQWAKEEYPIFFGDVGSNAPSFSNVWKKVEPKKGIIFVIGPEKGLDENEMECLLNLGAYGVKLHANILRTDTAPLCALSLIHHFSYQKALS